MLPRVTEILAAVDLDPDFFLVPPEILKAARARGIAVHAAIEAITYGYYDERLDPPDVAPYVVAYKKFCHDSGYRAHVAEIEVIHPAWRYRGHPDSIGLLGGQWVLVDWKTADSLNLKCVSYQVVAYFSAWNASHPTEQLHAAAAVQLNSDGDYKYHEIDVSAALPVWLAAVTIFYAKEGRRDQYGRHYRD